MVTQEARSDMIRAITEQEIPDCVQVIRERFHGRYPVRKSIQTEFAHVGGESGLQFQADAVAYCGPGSGEC